VNSYKPTETPVQTSSTRAPPPAETPRNCNLHIHEYGQSNSDTSVIVKYNFDNGRVAKPFKGSFTKSWNEEYQVPAKETGLHKSIFVKLTAKLPPDVPDTECPAKGGDSSSGGNSIKQRCGAAQWDSWLIQLKYGDVAWDSQRNQDLSKTPHFQVGDWDNNGWNGGRTVDFNRQMDCRFSC
jgi:hypothetical protein